MMTRRIVAAAALVAAAAGGRIGYAQSAGECIARMKEGVEHFRKSLDAGEAEKKDHLRRMYNAFKTALGPELQGPAVDAALEEEASTIDAGAKRALLFYFAADTCEQLKRYDRALAFIEKAIAEDDKEAYKEKKKQIEVKLGR